MQQLPLAIQLTPEGGFDDYLPGPNAEAVSAITAWASASGQAFLYLFGPSGTGKSHLLQAACKAAKAGGASACYLPLGLPGLDLSALEGMERAQVVALDDIQALAGDIDWERGLFNLYNRLRETERRLLVSGDRPAAELPLRLPDLRSRLGWGPGYRLRPLDEVGCERLLRESAARRGLVLEAESLAYIMRRCERDAGSLLRLLDRIDRESLQKKRRPTLWLIRQLQGSAD